jgi:nucleotide-binding universal stress UspA family protein
MFKNILVPTDGSERSDKAIATAIDYAKNSGASIVGISVAEPYPFSPLAESSMAIDPALYEENVKTWPTSTSRRSQTLRPPPACPARRKS